MPLFMVCSNAILNPDKLPRVEGENETAVLGTLVHGLCEELVRTGSYDLMKLKGRLSEEDFDRAGMLFNNFLVAWREAALFMPTPQVEVAFDVELSHCRLTGHIDSLQLDPARALILDYKTGRQHEDHFHQMAAYAFGAWDKAGRPPRFTVYVTTLYLEDNSVHNYTFDVSDLQAWEREVSGQVLKVGYTAGRKCANCPLRGCPGYRAFVSSALEVLREDYAIPQQTWDDMTPEQRGALHDRIYVVDKAIDRAKLGLRNLVKARGAVDMGGGMDQVLIEQEERQVDAVRALPVLLKRIGKGGVERHTRLKLDAVLGEFATKAAKGQKTRARKELLTELENAGAIVRVKTTKMWRRPRHEKLLQEGK
jgi:hypothetical protein